MSSFMMRRGSLFSPRARAEELARDRARREKGEEASKRLVPGATKSFGARGKPDGPGRLARGERGWAASSGQLAPDEAHAPATRRPEDAFGEPIAGAMPTPAEERADALVHELQSALAADNSSTAARVSVLIFRKYMEAMHQSMQNKDDRIGRLLWQLEQSRAEAQIVRLEQGRSASTDVQQARLAASDREHLQAKDRMLQLYDEREEDMQRKTDQLHETIRMVTQRLDALLVMQGTSLSFGVREEIHRVIEAASDTMPGDHGPDVLGREMGDRRAPPQPGLPAFNNSEVLPLLRPRMSCIPCKQMRAPRRNHVGSN
jgi:hypothetical protein